MTSPARRSLRSSRLAGYEGVRPDIQSLVPVSSARILDLGCSSGHLGAAIKARQPAYVVGIEADIVYASEASEVLDQAVHADLEHFLQDAERRAGLGTFDCVIAADVLEHLRNPWETLRLAASLLSPRGVVVVSVPNVRFWLTFWYIAVKRRWPLKDAGLFDRTHLRWFTDRDAEDLITEAGLAIVQRERNFKVNYYANASDRVLVPVLKRLPFRSFFIIQHLIVGAASADGSVDASMDVKTFVPSASSASI